MRLVMLDTETTGLSPQQGHKIVEIGAVEITDRDLNKKRTYQQYVNPRRSIPSEVTKIHNITEDMVRWEPEFSKVADKFLDFIDGATLVIHNAPFDVAFLANEFNDEQRKRFLAMPTVDSFGLAKELFPGKRNSLDILCDRFEVDRGKRKYHGALLDSELLAEVYLLMTGGSQFSLGLDKQVKTAADYYSSGVFDSMVKERSETTSLSRRPAVKMRSDDERAHERMMKLTHKESHGTLLWGLPDRLDQARDAIAAADAVLVIVGQDVFPSQSITKKKDGSDLGKKYPILKKLGLQQYHFFSANWVNINLDRAWAYYSLLHAKYYQLGLMDELAHLKLFADKMDGNCFIQTSGIYEELRQAGFKENEYFEMNGSLLQLQCTNTECDGMYVFSDEPLTVVETKFTVVDNIPLCKKCGQMMRPNIILKNDPSFDKQIWDSQRQNLLNWIAKQDEQGSKVVVLEVGVGVWEGDIRSDAEALAKKDHYTLVRVNDKNCFVPDDAIAIPFPPNKGFEMFLKI